MQNQPQSQNQQKSGLSWSTPPSTPGSKPVVATTPVSPQKALPTPVPAPTNMASYVGTLVGGIVIGVLLAWGYSATRGSSTVSTDMTNNTAAVTTTSTGSKTTTTATTNTPATVATSIAALPVTLASTQKAGMNVAIDNVKVATPTWVVVYDNINGKPGNTLGAHLFFTTGSGTVTLLRSTKAGTTYFVGMRVDNGDRKYARATDKAIAASDGSDALTTFVAQ